MLLLVSVLLAISGWWVWPENVLETTLSALTLGMIGRLLLAGFLFWLSIRLLMEVEVDKSAGPKMRKKKKPLQVEVRIDQSSASQAQALLTSKETNCQSDGSMANPIHLKLWVSDALGELLIDDCLDTEQQMERAEGQDGHILTAHVEYDEELWHWLLSQGCELMVLGPAVVVDDMRREVEELAKWYGEQASVAEAELVKNGGEA